MKQLKTDTDKQRKEFTNISAAASEAGREGYSTDRIVMREKWANSPFEIIGNEQKAMVCWGKWRMTEIEFIETEQNTAMGNAIIWCEQNEWTLILQAAGIIATNAIQQYEEEAQKIAKDFITETITAQSNKDIV